LFYNGFSHHVDIEDFKSPKYTKQKKYRTGKFKNYKAKNKKKNRGKYAFYDNVDNSLFLEN
jgi:hypothetical protein